MWIKVAHGWSSGWMMVLVCWPVRRAAAANEDEATQPQRVIRNGESVPKQKMLQRQGQWTIRSSGIAGRWVDRCREFVAAPNYFVLRLGLRSTRWPCRQGRPSNS
jgi:hypothetical protein